MVVMVGPPRPRPQVTWSRRVTHRSPVVSSGLQWSPVVSSGRDDKQSVAWRQTVWVARHPLWCLHRIICTLHSHGKMPSKQPICFVDSYLLWLCRCLQMSVEIYTAAVRQCKPAPALLAPCVEILLHGEHGGSSINQHYNWVECGVWVATARGAPVSGSSRHN